MGCSDREEPTVEELEYEKREKRVIAAIHALPLSKLTVADSLMLHGAFFHRHFGIGRYDIEMMEKILERVGS
jgi:hypothetical protein